jgi:hypothetical protein
MLPTWCACAGGETGVKGVDVKAQMHWAVKTENQYIFHNIDTSA